MIRILISSNKKFYKFFQNIMHCLEACLTIIKKVEYKFFKPQSYTILEDKILQIEKELRSKTALLHYTNHEIRTIIHGISGISQFLNEHWNLLDESERKKHIKSIYKHSVLMGNVMDESLDLFKISAGKKTMNFTKIDLIQSVNQVIIQCNNLYLVNKDIRVIFNHDGLEKTMIYGDQVMINKLLLNLFTNAIKYTDKGVITVTLAYMNSDISSWKLTISDEGIGIPGDELESIFELFIRSSRTPISTVGTGLGLAICKEIISAHNGSIWATNNNKNGAEFNVVIRAL